MKRILLYGAIVVLAFRLAWMFLIPAWSAISTDFQNYYTASWAVHHGDSLVDLYDPFWFDNEKESSGIHGDPALFNYYTPFSALVMLPVAGLSPLSALRVWTILSGAALVFLILLVARATSASVALAALIALLGGDALGNNFTFGQFYIVLTLLLVIGVYCKDRLPWLSGMSIALATVTKIFPGFLILYFAVTRRWRAFAWSVAGVFALSLIGVAVLGYAPHRVFIDEVVQRILRGEIQDPYNVHWNTLQALVRRALMPEPSLNPHPIMEAPALYFFLRTLISLAVAFVTFMALWRNSMSGRPVGPFLELGAIVTAISLITPSQASYHQFLLFPAIVAAVLYLKDLRVQAVLVGVFALICSNVMGATAHWSSGWAMLLAFPRVYLVVALWIVFLGILGFRSIPRRPLAIGLGIAMVVSGVSAAGELARWSEDQKDGATMVHPDPTSMIETFPTAGASSLEYASLKPSATEHPSAFKNGLIYEFHGTVYGHLADGHGFGWSGASEPSLGPNSVVAVLKDARGWAIVERSEHDSGWRELLRSSDLLHDPTLSADDSRMAFSEWSEGHYRIMEWNRQNQSVRPLISGSGDYRYPAYSPSNRWLFFSENTSGQWDVVRLSLQDGRREVLTSSEANDFMPAISPDEKTLYFASDRRRGYRFTAIYQMGLR